MGRPESAPIGAIDDILGALSAVRESVAIIATRGRGRLRREDLDELDRILAAAHRIQSYSMLIRAPLSARYQHHEDTPCILS